MEENLLMDNILTEDEAATLFDPDVADKKLPSVFELSNTEEVVQEDSKKKNTAEIAEGDNPFEDLQKELKPSTSESVGSEENTEGLEDTTSKEDDGTPSTNVFSSIASAFKEEGIFPDLEDDVIDSVTSAELFRDIVLKLIEAGLDDVQKRVYDALNNGVETSVIRQYENTLNYLDNITEEAINDESENGENLRRRLLQQDFLNRGYSQERAVRMTEKLFASGEDIEEAKLALISNKEYFGDKYKSILDEAKVELEKQRRALEKQAEQLRKDILTNDKIFGDITIDKTTRLKVYDNISKPVYKDKETGKYYTALLRYRMENENDYIKNVGLLYTLTDGFTNLDKLVQPTAKKEIKRKLKELEHTLNNTARSSNGVLKFVGSDGNTRNSKSFLDLGYILDVN